MPNRLKITLVRLNVDATSGSGDRYFSVHFHSSSNDVTASSNDVLDSPTKKYNIGSNSVLFDEDVIPGNPWHLEVWADKGDALLTDPAQYIGGVFIFTNDANQLGYSGLVVGRIFAPGQGGDPGDCISFRMEGSGASMKMLMKWEYNGSVFTGPPIGGWN